MTRDRLEWDQIKRDPLKRDQMPVGFFTALILGFLLGGCAVVPGFDSWLIPPPPVEPMTLSQAQQRAERHARQCHQRLQSGALHSHVEEAACINEYMRFYEAAGYPHVDLGHLLAALRLKLAREVDAARMTPQQAERRLIDRTIQVNAQIQRRERQASGENPHPPSAAPPPGQTIPQEPVRSEWSWPVYFLPGPNEPLPASESPVLD